MRRRAYTCREEKAMPYARVRRGLPWHFVLAGSKRTLCNVDVSSPAVVFTKSLFMGEIACKNCENLLGTVAQKAKQLELEKTPLAKKGKRRKRTATTGHWNRDDTKQIVSLVGMGLSMEQVVRRLETLPPARWVQD